MIAAIEWIPKGRANPTPSKYEYSRAEQEFLQKVTQAGERAEELLDIGGGVKNDDEEEWQDVEEDSDDNTNDDGDSKSKKKKIELPKIDPKSLPDDLNMDDYSDDDDDDDGGGVNERAVGNLLGVGKDAEMMEEAFTTNNPHNDGGKRTTEGISSDDDSEDDDDLADIPDTREYMPLDVEGLNSLGIGGGGGGGMNARDLQNMTMNNEDMLNEESDEEEDDEDDINDTKLQPSDALLVVAKTEEDYASLEINIFDTNSSNLYVHHDIPLPSYPLCLSLGNVVAGGQQQVEEEESSSTKVGNYVAVGSFEPSIEIWNLDVMNALEPTLVLGGVDHQDDDWMNTMISGKKKTNKKDKGKGGGLRNGSHTDAIMSLSWNTVHTQVLASGSADHTVKLWDVTSKGTNNGYIEPSVTLSHHTDKVCSLAWHVSEGTLLATGSYDRTVCLVDARSAAAVSSSSKSNVKSAKLAADCEALVWDTNNAQYLTVASEDGTVSCYDVRKFDKGPVWSMIAHDYGVSDICYNSQVSGMLVTCSIDKTVKLWDTRNLTPGSSPQLCGQKEMNVGKLYTASFYPSSQWLLACGGSGNELCVWDMEGEDAIQKRFSGDNSAALDDDGMSKDEEKEEPDFEKIMAMEDDKNDTTKSPKSKSKKGKGKKGKGKSKAHKRK